MTDPSQNVNSYVAWDAVRTFLIATVGGFALSSFHSCNDSESGSFNFGLAAIFGLAAGLFFTIGGYLRNKQDNALKKWCRDHGWIWIGDRSPFGRKGGSEFIESLKDARLFWRHYDGWEHVVVFDGDGISAAIGNIWYDTDPGSKNSTIKNAGFMVVRYEGDCPDTTLEPHHLTDMLPKMDGRSRVDFESAAFNKSWRVFSTDAKAAFDRFDQSTLEFLEATPFKPTIEFVGGVLVLELDHSKMYQESYREKVIRWVEDFSKAVPDDLMAPMKMLDR